MASLQVTVRGTPKGSVVCRALLAGASPISHISQRFKIGLAAMSERLCGEHWRLSERYYMHEVEGLLESNDCEFQHQTYAEQDHCVLSNHQLST